MGKGALQPEVLREELFAGEEPLQTKVLAYWPDGSEMDRTQWSERQKRQKTKRVQKKQAIVRKHNGIYFDNGDQRLFRNMGKGKCIGLGSGQWQKKL